MPQSWVLHSVFYQWWSLHFSSSFMFGQRPQYKRGWTPGNLGKSWGYELLQEAAPHCHLSTLQQRWCSPLKGHDALASLAPRVFLPLLEWTSPADPFPICSSLSHDTEPAAPCSKILARSLKVCLEGSSASKFVKPKSCSCLPYWPVIRMTPPTITTTGITIAWNARATIQSRKVALLLPLSGQPHHDNIPACLITPSWLPSCPKVHTIIPLRVFCCICKLCVCFKLQFQILFAVLRSWDNRRFFDGKELFCIDFVAVVTWWWQLLHWTLQARDRFSR